MALVMEEKKKQRHLVRNLALAATRQAWVASVMEEKKKQRHPVCNLALVATR